MAFFGTRRRSQTLQNQAKTQQGYAKTKGTTFSRKAALSYKNQSKMASLWTPKDPQKLKKCWKRLSQNQPQKNKKKRARE